MARARQPVRVVLLDLLVTCIASIICDLFLVLHLASTSCILHLSFFSFPPLFFYTIYFPLLAYMYWNYGGRLMRRTQHPEKDPSPNNHRRKRRRRLRRNCAKLIIVNFEPCLLFFYFFFYTFQLPAADRDLAGPGADHVSSLLYSPFPFF